MHEDELNYLREAFRKSKNYASLWDWPDKRIKERGIVCDLLESILRVSGRREIKKVHSSEVDPPDCIGTAVNGGFVAFEVTELVDQKTVELNKTGKSVFKQWSPDELTTKLQEKIATKDLKEFHGGPFSKVVLVIHTDEPLLSHADCEKILRGKKFGPCKKITDIYIIFSDVLGREFYPFIQLDMMGLFDAKQPASLAA